MLENRVGPFKNPYITAHASHHIGELGEIDKPVIAPFLGGIISSGGNLTISVSHSMHYKVRSTEKHVGAKIERHEEIIPHMLLCVTPEISYVGKEVDTDRLGKLYGGMSISNVTGDTTTWRLQGHKAVRLARSIREFLPEHKDAIEAFGKWRRTSPNKSTVIARDLKKLLAQKDALPKKEYLELVKNPLYLAGVVMARRAVPKQTAQETNREPHLDIDLENKGLLLALQAVYGGVPSSVDTKTQRLMLAGSEAERVLRIVQGAGTILGIHYLRSKAA